MRNTDVENRQLSRRRRHAVWVGVALVLFVTACTAPSLPGPPPTWERRDTVTGALSDHSGAMPEGVALAGAHEAVVFTDLDLGVPVGRRLDIFGRSTGDMTLQTSFPLADTDPVPDGVGMSDHVIAVPQVDVTQSWATVRLFRWVEVGDSWVEGDTVSFATSVPNEISDRPYQFPASYSLRVAVEDDRLVIGESSLLDGTSSIGSVRVYDLDISGADVDATAVQTILPPSGWSSTERASFGGMVSIDGDLLAVASNAGVVGLRTLHSWVTTFRSTPAGFVPEATFDGGSGGRYASLVVDTDGGNDRMASLLAPLLQGPVLTVSKFDGSWQAERTFTPTSGVPTAAVSFGSTVDLDGDTLAFTGSPRITWPATSVFRYPVDVYRLGTSGWTFDTYLVPTGVVTTELEIVAPAGIALDGGRLAVRASNSAAGPSYSYNVVNYRRL